MRSADDIHQNIIQGSLLLPTPGNSSLATVHLWAFPFFGFIKMHC